MNTIKFSKPWNNKMCCNIFTAIRPHNPEKYKVDHIYNCDTTLINSIYKHRVKIRRIYTHKLADIHDAIFSVDMGMCKELAIREIQETYKNIDVDNVLWDILVLEHYYDIV